MGRRRAGGRQWGVPILLASLATVAAGPHLFFPGFLNTRGGGDSPFLLFRLNQIVTALADGHFPVRWMPDAAYGLGYPFFNYYAALPYYVGAALTSWGFGFVAAVKLTQWLGFILAAWAMWNLVHHLTRGAAGQGNPWAAGLSAVAYTFAPYHLVNVYVRGDSLTEFWAMGLYPLVLWMALLLWERPGRARLALLALGYAALILTHNISALIFSPFLLLFLALLGRRKEWRKGGWLAAGLLLGFALSAFYWLPALGEQDAVQLGAQTSGYFHYSNHFRTLAFSGSGQDLVQSSPAFDFEIAGRTPFSMGLAQAVLMVASLVAAILTTIRPRSDLAVHRFVIPIFGSLTVLISTLMITPISRLLWDRLPLLPFVQFPWRFLSIQALGIAILATSLFPTPGPRSPTPVSRSLILAALSILIAVTSLTGLQPDRVALASADVTAENLQLYEWFSGNVGTTIRHEYLPAAVIPRLYTSDSVITGERMEARMLAGEASAVRLEKRTGWESWQVDVVSASATISFPTLYWPGWQARVDGEGRALRPAESLGTIALDLPAGEHKVELRLGRTPLRRGAELVSLVALLATLACLVELKPHAPSFVRRLLTVALFLILVGVVLHLLPTPSPSPDDLTWDFAQQTYLHHNPEGVPFEEAAVMQGYQITERGSGEWDIAIQWAEIKRPDLEVELALVHPAEAQGRTSYTLASEQQTLEASQIRTTFALRAPDSTPPGPLLPRLRLYQQGEAIAALTSAGRERGELFLRPVWSPGSPSDPGQEGPLQLAGARVEALAPERLAVTLDWAVGDLIPANYKVALRLRDPAGNEWSALDSQPNYGFYPTGSWQPGTTFSDRLAISVPYGLPPGDYALSVVLYDAVTLAPTWGPEERQVAVSAIAPYDGRPLVHRFSTAVAAAEVTMAEAIDQGDRFSFTVAWVGLEEMDAPAPFRWELVGEDGLVAADGSGELTLEPGSLVLGRQSGGTDPVAPAGDYALRLALGDGESWEAGTITIRERARRYELPEMEIPLNVDYGGLIRLEGADLVQEETLIRLTLYWRSQAAIPSDYLVFVHLFDPATEEIPVQHDALPRGNSYPMSQWAAGEVVDDPITLSLASVRPGLYRLGVGLYQQDGDQYPRLPAVDTDGQPVPAGRLVLPVEIIVPAIP